MSAILVDGFDDVGNVPGVGTEEGVHRYLVVQIDHWCALRLREALGGHGMEGGLTKGLIGLSLE